MARSISAGVNPSSTTDPNTCEVTLVTSSNRSGEQPAYTDKAPVSEKVSTVEYTAYTSPRCSRIS
ncbi:Uncharacterised protein [Mycobacteroides abscessus subsp. abscessus]|nr:Uncharacterised protein [Mycobacteroides abscessus subsp. abscessus]